MSKKLNLSEKEICEKYKNGMNINKLAKEYGCDRGVITRRLRKNNIKIKSISETLKGLYTGKNNSNYIHLPEQEICEKYKNGINSYQLAEEHGCSIQPILRVLHDNNIKIRSNFDSHIGSIAGKKNVNYINLPMEEICKKYLNGVHPYELAEEYGCSTPTIFVKLKQSGIHIRTLKESNDMISSHICTKCGQKYSGKQSSKFCPDCSLTGYCYKFDEDCRESNRDKYNNECFFCGKTEKENGRKHNVHHTDYNKNQGCGKTPDWKLVPLCNKCHGITGGNIKNRSIWEDRILYLYKEYWRNSNTDSIKHNEEIMRFKTLKVLNHKLYMG